MIASNHFAEFTVFFFLFHFHFIEESVERLVRMEIL